MIKEIDISGKHWYHSVAFIRSITDLVPMGGRGGPWIAGGVARDIFLGIGDIRGDVDIFITSEEQLTALKKAFQILDRNHFVSSRGNVTDIRVNDVRVQAICMPHLVEVNDLFNTFDFNVSKVETDGYRLRFTPRAEHDLGQMVLDIDGQNYFRLPTVSRVAKYCRYGFTPIPGLLTKLEVFKRAKIDDNFQLIY